MKTLDVSSLESGVEQILVKLSQQKEQINDMQAAVNNLISQEDTFKGKGGQSIRNFYQDAHQSFMDFFQQVMSNYESVINKITHELQGLESDSNGVIKEGFLQHDVENGLNKARDIVIDLTNESNQTIQTVSDIVSLPKLQDSSFLQQTHKARLHKDETVENLNLFDHTQNAALTPIQDDVQIMNQYIREIQGLFTSGSISIGTYQPNVCYNPNNTQYVQNDNPYAELVNNPRFVSNGVEASDTANGETVWDPTPTLGINIDQWREQPVNAAANLGVIGATAYGASKSVNLARQGFGVTKTHYTTAQGQRRVRLLVDKPELNNINKKTYSGANATNYTKVYKLVDPMTSVKQSFKWAGNRLGYIGVGTTVVGDIAHGIENEQSGSEIAGNVTGDVAVAGASIASSAYAGALVGGAIGGPVGIAVGAAVGALAGIAVSTILSDIKFMDVDNDGKSDSIGDAIKKGTTGIINKIGSWFD
ncbi:LXG domain-containing protein [Aquibacillus rhizosphaerae]|uniref:LXG domain-containing protein n=1 Tax=Aquibacillus rhizosphaerae TaxID=3051431 RepID=A0ABT7LBL8_9BACI|nr:LXG domain-containing protein [Aquibacillus sp. LR5S19]MDL4842647.1 LXG domain-containing protein [Aquibacillus sp. LR5S19]